MIVMFSAQTHCGAPDVNHDIITLMFQVGQHHSNKQH